MRSASTSGARTLPSSGRARARTSLKGRDRQIWQRGVAAIEREYKSAAKSKGARFYLGCYWLDAPRNAALSKPLRAMVWRSWFATVPHDANGDAMCPCCGSARISALEFHLGHKTSFARGGTDERCARRATPPWERATSTSTARRSTARAALLLRM